uniref:Uncharacterized protein n=1 Tax=Candidatus Kentrum sp. FM TaxID=2126340 RepID=A0A450RW61_9GAMM|nr:MAG: hypothetical protein BECKFM1743A_GA0114220_1000113 [Candidatus Kentron sp. FM]VFJ43349.1 MAG: hypothetical protein BECKFM1743C_GA0114222_1000113 [Candidatus Kentron sp. FM]VFK05505.1 MAG: hypothetical protein BECKFM1743B_GA0114221_1000113 [Candidatus Kentron sp. FM]
MDPLQEWKEEPLSYRVLVVFTGNRREEMEGFLEVWLRWDGDLNLSAAPVNGGDAIFIGRPPAYHLIGWWLLRSASWQLFYQPRIPSKEGVESHEPTGEFWSWGFQSTEEIIQTGPAFMIEPDGTRTELPEKFDNLFEKLDRGSLVFHPPGDDSITPSQGLGATERPYALPLRVMVEQKDAKPTNPEADLRRIRDRIRELKEQEDTLAWWTGESDINVEMWVYRETEDREIGSLWKLRDWFAGASAAHIEEFHHLRVVTEQLGVLHLLRPADPKRTLTATLPKSVFHLKQDRRWQQEGYEVFVEKDHELVPPPPFKNRHIVRLMASALWEDANPQDTLVLLPTKDNKIHRLAVHGFAPLKDRIQELNFQLAMERSRETPTNVRLPEALLERVRGDLNEALCVHIKEMDKLLDAIWNRDRANLDRYRREVLQALNDVRQFQEQQRKVEELIVHYRKEADAQQKEIEKLLTDIERIRSDMNGLRTQALKTRASAQHSVTNLRKLADRWR